MPSPPHHEHEALMRHCLTLARIALQQGDIPVGALIARADVILVEARETLPSTPDIIGHAELLAIRAACQTLQSLDLSGLSLYTTAEPCWMCAYAIREARLSRVVIGTLIPHIGGYSSAFPILSTRDVPHWAAPPDIVQGVLAEECQALRKLLP